jgi:hypothetical protein
MYSSMIGRLPCAGTAADEDTARGASRGASGESWQADRNKTARTPKDNFLMRTPVAGLGPAG